MSEASESAEQLMNSIIKGTEAGVTITGKGAEKITLMVLSALKNSRPTRGQVRLIKLLKKGYTLTAFELDKSDLKVFKKQAKRYGIEYSLLVEKGSKAVEVIAKESDASIINRVISKYNLNRTNENKEHLDNNNSPSNRGNTETRSQLKNSLEGTKEDRKSVRKELAKIKEERKKKKSKSKNKNKNRNKFKKGQVK